jgi:hypothetical protein
MAISRTTPAARLQMALSDCMTYHDHEELTFLNNMFYEIDQLKPTDRARQLTTDQLFDHLAKKMLADTASNALRHQMLTSKNLLEQTIKTTAQCFELYSRTELETLGFESIIIRNQPIQAVAPTPSFWQAPTLKTMLGGNRDTSVLLTDSDTDSAKSTPEPTDGYDSSDEEAEEKQASSFTNPFSLS